MDLEMLQNARLALAQQQMVQMPGSSSGPSGHQRLAQLDMSHQGLGSQGSGGYNQQMGGLSQSAMLVGTVAALQQESGQLRNQWKSDVSRLESELSQLRSAAAWALPHLQNGADQNEPRLQMLHGNGAMERSAMERSAAMERSSSTGTLNSALADRLNRERGLDALLAQGAMGERAKLEAAIMQGAQPVCSDQNSLLHNRERELMEQLALLRQSEFSNRGSTGGSQMAEQVRQQNMLLQMQRNSSAGNLNMMGATCNFGGASSEPGGHRAMSSAASAVSEPQYASAVRGRATVDQAAVEQAAMQMNKMAAEQSAAQMKELYTELEKMTMRLQEVVQENNQLKEDKEASVDAHSRDISALEQMLQSLGADNERLTKALAKAEERMAKLETAARPQSSCASVRTASVEPASEPGSSVADQAEIDRIKFKIGFDANR